MDLFVALLIWCFLSLGVAALAGARGRSGPGFFLLSFVFSPLLGLIVVLVVRNLKLEAERDAEQRRQDETRQVERVREHEKQLESLRAIASSAAISGQSSANVAALVADELTKLAGLRDAGVLTKDEFEQQKSALLSRSQSS